MGNPKIVMWNCGGLRATTKSTPKKILFFDKEFPKANFEIAVFLETHHKNENEIPAYFQQIQTTHHIIHTPTSRDSTHEGIIALISKEYEIIKEDIIIQGRLINIHLNNKSNNKKYNISMFYGPTDKNTNMENTINIYNEFHNLHCNGENNYILGDFNFVDNDLDKTKGMDKRDKSITKYWHEFKTNIDMLEYANGLYLLKINSKDFDYVKKIVKQ